MRAWDYHTRILRERQAREALNAAREETASAKAPSAEQKLLLTALERDCQGLSDLPQGPARLERKRELVRLWLPVVTKYQASGEKYRNPVLTQVMVWLFDISDIDAAMRLARLAIEQEQPLPDRFIRDIRTGVADLVMTWINTRNGQAVEPYFSEIFDQIFPADGPGWAIHDEIKIKYLKVAIREAEKRGDLNLALELCSTAERIAPEKAKVKTKKAELQKALAKR